MTQFLVVYFCLNLYGRYEIRRFKLKKYFPLYIWEGIGVKDGEYCLGENKYINGNNVRLKISHGKKEVKLNCERSI